MKRLMVVARASALTLLLAAQADAATLWAAPTAPTSSGGADSTGADSTHAHTLGWINSHLSPGDVVRFKSGAYLASINPTAQGLSGSRITFLGFPQDPGAVRLNDIAFGTTSNDRGNYCTARWLTTANFTGSVRSIGDSCIRVSATGVSQLNVGGRSGIFDSCTVTGSMTGTGQNHLLAFSGQRSGVVLYTAGPDSGLRDSIRGQWDWGSINNRFQNGTVNATINTTSGQGDCHVFLLAAAEANGIVNNTINVTVTHCHGYLFPLEMYEGYDTDVRGNTWNIVMNGVAESSRGVWSMRDSSSYNRYVANNVNVSGSGGDMSIMWTNGGSWSDGRGHNYMGFNTIKDASPQANTGVLWFLDGGNCDTVEYNTIAAQGGPCVQLQGAPDSLICRQNTLYSTGKQCFLVKDSNPTASKIHLNVLVARPFNTNTYNATDGFCINAIQQASFGSDSNYFAPSVLWKVGSDPSWPHRYLDQSGYYSQGQASWQVATGNDVHSRASMFSAGLFVDARWATLDLHPAPCSPLSNPALPLGRYGALAGSSCH